MHLAPLRLFFIFICIRISLHDALICEASTPDWNFVLNSANSSLFWTNEAQIGVVMQVTEAIKEYAKFFVAVTSSWCKERGIPLIVYGPLPLQGCNETHPTPPGMDHRFGKVQLFILLFIFLVKQIE